MERSHRWPALRRAVLLLGALTLIHGDPVQGRDARQSSVDDLLVCDCVLLKRKRMGASLPPMLARTPPFRTTVEECKKRGGQFVLYSGTDRGAALDMWLPSAEGGSAEAQNAVGEIYERGLGEAPDFVAAAQWYRKAAEQGFKAAQNNLAYLLEKGLGVEPSPEDAVSWYRKASDVPEAIALTSPPDTTRPSTGPPVPTEAPHIVLLEPPLIAHQGATIVPITSGALLGRVTAPAGVLSLIILGQAASVNSRGIFDVPVSGLQQELPVLLTATDRLGQRVSVEFALSPDSAVPTPPVSFRSEELGLGRFSALIIGNGAYAEWPGMPTAENDAREVAKVLESRFGFEVTLLLNASRETMIRAIHEASRKVGKRDSFLLYFAGHGRLEDENWLDGYWMPVDAGMGSRANWVPISEIVARANLLPARKTLVIVDSAFHVMRTSSASPRVDPGLSGEAREQAYVHLATARTMVALASGVFSPTPSQVDGTRSPFGLALTEVLVASNDILDARRLHDEVSARVAGVEGPGSPLPDYTSIRGHEGGDFFFVPR